jgi:hypothetical protein
VGVEDTVGLKGTIAEISIPPAYSSRTGRQEVRSKGRRRSLGSSRSCIIKTKAKKARADYQLFARRTRARHRHRVAILIFDLRGNETIQMEASGRWWEVEQVGQRRGILASETRNEKRKEPDFLILRWLPKKKLHREMNGLTLAGKRQRR